MTQVEQSGNGRTTIMCWLARLIGLVAAGLFVVSVVVSGARVFPGISWSSPQGTPLLIALVAAVAGVLIAWRWELVGGIMTMTGAFAIIILVSLGSGTDMLFCALLFTLPFLVAGALYLGCCWRKKAATQMQEA